MAAPKNTAKTAPSKAKPKSAAKPAAKTSPSKPAAKKPAVTAKKPAVTAKKPVVTAKKPAAKPGKAAPAKPAKPAATKKSAPAKKPAPAKKAAPAKVPAKKPAAKKAQPLKKAIATTPKASPAAPVVKAPAAKAVVPKAKPTAPAATNGSHSPAFIQKQKQRLLDLRDELVDSMSGMTRDTIRNAPEGSEASGSGQHQGDAGSDAYDRDFALSVLAKEQDALYEIEQALRRIQTGAYGICEISQKKIPQARLEAIPFARLTVECQAQWEKEYGKRRFRPSNEVGFSGGNYIEDEDSEAVSLDEEEE